MNELARKVEVLEKVKALTLLPDGVHVTTQMVADYYEVSFKAIRSIIMRHREELESDGMNRGQELKEYKDKIQQESFRNVFAHLSIFQRRAVLRIGMLLRDSEVAKAIERWEILARKILRVFVMFLCMYSILNR
ncbi:hypothetical protein [Ammoniphilus sp. CFH 90114]|uniref:hypothetical protein n=1 Tax=Ammoniphilus sp. CFH 90114 TaxID=2493665 RepID=UPI0013E91B5F|nr:hypothetical protein [Ammoniphilus sp. CFH 90114]